MNRLPLWESFAMPAEFNGRSITFILAFHVGKKETVTKMVYLALIDARVDGA